MKISYWSDYACPYCYIAEARLHKAIAELGMEDQVELEPRAFQLDPAAPNEVVSDTASRFASKYRIPLQEAVAQIEHISSLGRAEGIDFRYATTQFTNTFNAHRLMKLALSKNDRQLAAKMNELLFAAYFTKNLRLADDAVLLEAGKLAGLEEKEIEEVLRSNKFGPEVREDERAAAERGVRGVPYFIFPGGFTIPGAISKEDFKDALRRALMHEKPRQPANAQQCGPDGCKVDFS